MEHRMAKISASAKQNMFGVVPKWSALLNAVK